MPPGSQSRDRNNKWLYDPDCLRGPQRGDGNRKWPHKPCHLGKWHHNLCCTGVPSQGMEIRSGSIPILSRVPHNGGESRKKLFLINFFHIPNCGSNYKHVYNRHAMGNKKQLPVEVSVEKRFWCCWCHNPGTTISQNPKLKGVGAGGGGGIQGPGLAAPGVMP